MKAATTRAPGVPEIPPGPAPVPEKPITLSGKVGSITGQCPNVTSVVANRTVIANSATDFQMGSCKSLKVDTEVKVEGVEKVGRCHYRDCDLEALTARVRTIRRTLEAAAQLYRQLGSAPLAGMSGVGSGRFCRSRGSERDRGSAR